MITVHYLWNAKLYMAYHHRLRDADDGGEGAPTAAPAAAAARCSCCCASATCCGSRLGALAAAAAALATVGCVVAVVLLAVRGGPDPNPSVVGFSQIVHVSDFHLDSFYDPRLPIQHCHCHARPASVDPSGTCTGASGSAPRRSGASGSYACDAPEAMVRAAVTMTARAAATAVGILVSGDLTRHWTAEAADASAMVRSAFADVTSFFRKELHDAGASTTPNFVAWGNDDFSKNYLFNTSLPCDEQSLMQQTAKMVQTNLPTLRTAEASRMQCAGFYRYDMGSGGIRVLVLNTVMYSVKRSRWFPNAADDPMGQFRWLREELKSCRDEKKCTGVWILAHIAPGRESCVGNSMWLEHYVEQYVSILRADARAAGGGALKAQFFGHEHVNSMRLISADKRDAGIPPIFIQAAVSTIYENRPSLRVVDFDAKDGTLMDFTVWTSRAVDDNIDAGDTAKLEASWSESFSARKEFALDDLSAPAVLAMMETFTVDPTTGEESEALRLFLDRAWDRGEGISMPPPGSPCVRVPEFCNLKYTLEKEIVACLNRRRRQQGEVDAEEGGRHEYPRAQTLY